MNKFIFLVSLFLFFGVAVITFSSHACGGGEEIVINDDTILRDNGFFFPITDPEDKAPALIETQWKKFETCTKTDLSGALSGRCARAINLDLTDAKGVATHIVQMTLRNNIATYKITDLKTKEKRTFKAALHTRGGCGLQEVLDQQ